MLRLRPECGTRHLHCYDKGNESRFWQTALHASVSPRAVLASSCAAAPLPPCCSLAEASSEIILLEDSNQHVLSEP